jgi:alkylation response protein AidB-like acyl-CoA dehydrogenase
MEFFNRSRAYVAAQGVGVAQGALEMALEYVRKSDQSGRSFPFLEIVQSKLAEMATLTEAARNLVYKAAWMLDRGQVEPAPGYFRSFFLVISENNIERQSRTSTWDAPRQAHFLICPILTTASCL